jgi:hypothetical protein
MPCAVRPTLGSPILRSMFELLALLLAIVRAALRRRTDLLAGNRLLRHRLAVLTRPTRTRPAVRSGDKLLWVVARRLRRDWRRLSGGRNRSAYAARSYAWWRPPRTGLARIGPCRRRVAGRGVSSESARCGRLAL